MTRAQRWSRWWRANISGLAANTSLGLMLGLVPALFGFIGLGIMGLGMSSTDVMMNVEAAAVEQSFGKTLMPLFHALFSVGTVAGAGVGVAMAAWNVGVSWHLWAVGVIVLVALLAGRTALRGFLETHAAGWHVDAAVFTDAFLLFAVGLIVAQRLEMYIRARRVMAGEPDSHLAAVA